LDTLINNIDRSVKSKDPAWFMSNKILTKKALYNDAYDKHLLSKQDPVSIKCNKAWPNGGRL
ncbi:hypothetical protein DPMN_145350, partial [Dreissena polymorpha]